MKKHYLIFDRFSGLLVGSMLWQDAYFLFHKHSNRIAVRITSKGKYQIRWLCTGLDATAEENRQELDRLKAIRGDGDLPR